MTPFMESGGVDESSLKRLVDHVIDGGLQGIYSCGNAGERPYLTLTERKRIAEATVAQADRRVPVFIHAGAGDLKATLELSRYAESIGADGIGIAAPSVLRRAQEQMEFYISVASSVSDDFPVYLYSISRERAGHLNAEHCERLARQCRNVIGIQYSHTDFARMQKYKKINGRDFGVLTDLDYLFSAFSVAGCDGVISGNAMIIREHYAVIWNAVQRRDYELASKCQRRANILNDRMSDSDRISAFKVLLREEGVIRTSRTRRLAGKMTAAQEQALIRDMKQLNYKSVILM